MKMAATIGQKHKNGFKIVEMWDNHSESLKNNLYNNLKGPEHLLGGMNLENEIDTCQTTVRGAFSNQVTLMPSFVMSAKYSLYNFFSYTNMPLVSILTLLQLSNWPVPLKES